MQRGVAIGVYASGIYVGGGLASLSIIIAQQVVTTVPSCLPNCCRAGLLRLAFVPASLAVFLCAMLTSLCTPFPSELCVLVRQIGWRGACFLVGSIGVVLSLVVLVTIRELSETERVRYQMAAAANDTLPILPGTRIDKRSVSAVGIALTNGPGGPMGTPTGSSSPVSMTALGARHSCDSSDGDSVHSVDGDAFPDRGTVRVAPMLGSPVIGSEGGDDVSTVLLHSRQVRRHSLSTVWEFGSRRSTDRHTDAQSDTHKCTLRQTVTLLLSVW